MKTTGWSPIVTLWTSGGMRMFITAGAAQEKSPAGAGLLVKVGPAKSASTQNLAFRPIW
jgi:hypothetical protein